MHAAMAEHFNLNRDTDVDEFLDRLAINRAVAVSINRIDCEVAAHRIFLPVAPEHNFGMAPIAPDVATQGGDFIILATWLLSFADRRVVIFGHNSRHRAMCEPRGDGANPGFFQTFQNSLRC